MASYYELSSPPSGDTVKSDEARDFCKIRAGADKEVFEALLATAVDFAERYLNRALLTRTFEGYFSALLTSEQERYPFIALEKAPLGAITSVKTLISDVWTDVSSDDYQLKSSNRFSRILFTSSLTADDVPYPLQVIFTAGYGTEADIPKSIKTGIKAHTLFLYENRGDSKPDGGLRLPLQVQSMYSKYRILDMF